jgi:hypothetical protein
MGNNCNICRTTSPASNRGCTSHLAAQRLCCPQVRALLADVVGAHHKQAGHLLSQLSTHHLQPRQHSKAQWDSSKASRHSGRAARQRQTRQTTAVKVHANHTGKQHRCDRYSSGLTQPQLQPRWWWHTAELCSVVAGGAAAGSAPPPSCRSPPAGEGRCAWAGHKWCPA